MAVPVKYNLLTVRKLHVGINSEKFIWLALFTGTEFGPFSGAWG